MSVSSVSPASFHLVSTVATRRGSAFVVFFDDEHASLVKRVEGRVYLACLGASRAVRVPADEGQVPGSAARRPAGAFAVPGPDRLAGEPGERGDVQPVGISEPGEHRLAVRLAEAVDVDGPGFHPHRDPLLTLAARRLRSRCWSLRQAETAPSAACSSHSWSVSSQLMTGAASISSSICVSSSFSSCWMTDLPTAPRV